MSLAIALAIGTATMAQLSIGVHATGNLSSANVKSTEFLDGMKKTSRLLPGAGILVDYSVNENFSVQSGLNYRKNGVSLKYEIPIENQVFTMKVTSDLNYIQVPLNFVYKTNSSTVQFIAGAGPYAAIGISGKNKVKIIAADGEVIEEQESDAFKKEEDGGSDMKRFDFGAQALVGIKVGKYYATVSYQAGLTNLVQGDETDGKYNNRGAQLTLGYIIR